jgi:hypothetical protein
MGKPMEFRTIPGYSAYEISEDGETIRRIKGGQGARDGHVLRQWLRPEGYKQIWLVNDDGERKGMFVHRLVVAAFIGELGDLQVNHKDGVRANNNVENLELVTAKENIAHAIDVLGKKFGESRGERHYAAKLKESDIPVILERRLQGETQKSIADDYGVVPQTISNICCGRKWKHATSYGGLGEAQTSNSSLT